MPLADTFIYPSQRQCLEIKMIKIIKIRKVDHWYEADIKTVLNKKVPFCLFLPCSLEHVMP